VTAIAGSRARCCLPVLSAEDYGIFRDIRAPAKTCAFILGLRHACRCCGCGGDGSGGSSGESAIDIRPSPPCPRCRCKRVASADANGHGNCDSDFRRSRCANAHTSDPSIIDRHHGQRWERRFASLGKLAGTDWRFFDWDRRSWGTCRLSPSPSSAGRGAGRFWPILPIGAKRAGRDHGQEGP
jgi:hypothetical protein